MIKTNKLPKYILVVALLIAVIFLVGKLVVINSVADALEDGVTVNPFSYYENPHDAINEALIYCRDVGDKDEEKSYIYKTKIFIAEDDNDYIEFFIADDDYTVWYVLLDKQCTDDASKYRAEYYHNYVQFDKYEWKNIVNGKSYLVVDSKEKIEEVDGKSPEVIPFSINTQQGKMELYLLYLEQWFNNSLLKII